MLAAILPVPSLVPRPAAAAPVTRTAARPSHAPRDSVRVDTILIERANVFSESEKGLTAFLARTANALHWLTHENVIRRELLLHPGDVYNPALADESERNLRATRLFGKVEVSPRRDPQGVALDVATQDRFTLHTGGAYSLQGQVEDWRVFYGERNFLGRGIRVHAELNSSTDRRRRLGTVFGLDERRFFSTRWHLNVERRDAEDLRRSALALDHRFPIEADRWGSALYSEYGSDRWRLYKDGVIERENRRHLQNGYAWAAASRGDATKFRLSSGYEWARNRSPEGAWDDRLDLVPVSLSIAHRRFAKASNLDNLYVTEDVPLGIQQVVTFAVNASPPGPRVPESYGAAALGGGFGRAGRRYLGLDLRVRTFFDEGRMRDAHVDLTNVAHLRFAHGHLLVARTEVDLSRDSSPGRQFTLDSGSGLRGYPANRLSGDHRVLLNLEERTRELWRIWVFRFAGAAFVDAGSCWNDHVPLSRSVWRSSAGLGLRIGNIKGTGSGLFRIDVPVRLTDGKIPEVIITTDQLFSSFLNLDFIGPEHQR